MNENLSFMKFPSMPKLAANRKQKIEKVIEVLSGQGIQVFQLDGKEIENKETSLIKTAEVMKFPAYFGLNWDALEECITDLAWCAADMATYLNLCCCNLSCTQAISDSDKAGIGGRL